jgi:pimeloyl-ACP methyl ester carboxylesterase
MQRLRSLFSLHSFQDFQIAGLKQVQLVFQTFGNPVNPCLVFIPGLEGVSLAWPSDFCQKFVEKGFYVLRYDQRDSGLSGCFPSSKSYDFLTMMYDLNDLIEYLKLDKVHLMGMDIGAAIA